MCDCPQLAISPTSYLIRLKHHYYFRASIMATMTGISTSSLTLFRWLFPSPCSRTFLQLVVAYNRQEGKVREVHDERRVDSRRKPMDTGQSRACSLPTHTHCSSHNNAQLGIRIPSREQEREPYNNNRATEEIQIHLHLQTLHAPNSLSIYGSRGIKVWLDGLFAWVQILSQ